MPAKSLELRYTIRLIRELDAGVDTHGKIFRVWCRSDRA